MLSVDDVIEKHSNSLYQQELFFKETTTTMLDVTNPDIVMVALPKGFRFLNQFASPQWAKLAKTLCFETSVAMADEFQRPGDQIPEHLIEILASSASADAAAITLDEAAKILASCKLNFIDLQSLVDEFNRGDRTLHAEIMAQNSQNVMQLFTINDASELYEAVSNPNSADPQNPYVRGKKLHAWEDAGKSHSFVRLGYSKTGGIGLYGEPAAVGFDQPVPILWQDIVNAGIAHVWAILAEGVALPPAGFLFQSGAWPTPPPPQVTVDVAALNNSLMILKATTNTAAQGIAHIEELLGIKASS